MRINRKVRARRYIQKNFETYEEYKLRVRFLLEKELEEKIKHNKGKGKRRLKVILVIKG